MRPFFHRDFLCIGHRGAPVIAPENTLKAFAAAIAQGVDAIELDVQLVEGALVVIHDDDLDRTTSGHGPVAASSLRILRGLDAGQGERIPLLEEVVTLVAGRVGINVELKGPGTAGPVADLLRRCRIPPASCLLSAFDHRELEAARAAAPEFPRAALFGRLTRDPVRVARALDAMAINLYRKTARADVISAARTAGLATLVYTVNDPTEALLLKRLGSAGVFSDRPDLIIEAMALQQGTG